MKDIFNDFYAFGQFVEENCPSTEILHVQEYGKHGNCAIIKVSSFKDCETLFKDCTKWCIAGNEQYWNQYAGPLTDNSQYFIINFAMEDSEIFKLIGFTVSPEGKLTAAHAINDDDLLKDKSVKYRRYKLKNGYWLNSFGKDCANGFWQYAKAFGIKKFIKYQIMGEEEKNLNYLFKKLFY